MLTVQKYNPKPRNSTLPDFTPNRFAEIIDKWNRSVQIMSTTAQWQKQLHALNHYGQNKRMIKKATTPSKTIQGQML